MSTYQKRTKVIIEGGEGQRDGRRKEGRKGGRNTWTHEPKERGGGVRGREAGERQGRGRER